MGVYNDMANDAGCSYGTDENAQMAQWLEEDHMRQYQEWLCEQEDSANQGSPLNQCSHGINWQNPCSQCGRAIPAIT